MIPAIFGIAGTQLAADERAFFKDADPAGYILFARNCDNPDQLRALTDDLRSIHGREKTFISIDQEGGRVQRMKPPHWASYPAGEAFDRLYALAPASAIEAARVNAHAMALELASMGITVDFHAPFDVRRPETDQAIGDRSLGSDPMQVAALGRAVLDGMTSGGVAGCLKHMPGHGRATADSHKELPVVCASAEELEVDIAPFRALAEKAHIGMSAHIVFEAWDTDRPATLSPTVIENVIRKDIGFEGLLLTDDIDMQALDGTIPERAEAALAAGCDIVLNCWAKMDDQIGIADRVSSMSDTLREKLDRALEGTGPGNDAAEQAELLAKRDALLALEGQAA
ncbi:beta-N-acetylhexosaminidase [Altererythrobacter lutimaris]|uniref:beta-N-acetylhexosaminidase n=1 Tax=Altererythrobacter lutimaris TaxID=2743979 RepID=A0A850H672_9SPHN|nr:beta-N-acetylhexosaminidase [Altererythrobacter lutimaris]NVE94734.1 beta-N-acetylhexosaminidase [Altererythrobacter lutimaris]